MFKNTNDLEIKKNFESFADAFIKHRNYIYDELKGNRESKDKAEEVYVNKLFMMINDFEAHCNPKPRRKAKCVISQTKSY